LTFLAFFIKDNLFPPKSKKNCLKDPKNWPESLAGIWHPRDSRPLKKFESQYRVLYITVIVCCAQMSQPGQQVPAGQALTLCVVVFLYQTGLIGIHIPR